MTNVSLRLRLYLALALILLFVAASISSTLYIWRQEIGFFHADADFLAAEQAFAMVAPHVASEQALGYISDETASPQHYLKAQYFLTPRILVNLDTSYLEGIPQPAEQPNVPYRLIIGHFRSPEARDRILADKGLSIVRQITEQLFILEE